MLQYPKRLSLSAALLLGLSGTAATAGAEPPDQDSVHSWGRWEVLAPAAGGVPTVSALPVESGVELRPGEATSLTPQFQTVNQNGGGSEPPAEIEEPVVVPNPPGSPPPSGDPRTSVPEGGEQIVVLNPSSVSPSGGPRD